MHSFLNRVLVLSMAILLCACSSYMAWEKNRAAAIYEKQIYTFDLSSSVESGELIIRISPPSQQPPVKNYTIEIAGYAPLSVFKHSVVNIKLNPGKHHLMITPLSFAAPSTTDFTLEPNGKVVFEYTGPFWTVSQGELKRVD